MQLSFKWMLYILYIFKMCRSYGVLVWEIMTFGGTPHEELQTRDIVDMADKGTLQLSW